MFISGQCLNDVKRAINQLYHLLVVMLRFIGPRVSGPPRGDITNTYSYDYIHFITPITFKVGEVHAQNRANALNPCSILTVSQKKLDTGL